MEMDGLPRSSTLRVLLLKVVPFGTQLFQVFPSLDPFLIFQTLDQPGLTTALQVYNIYAHPGIIQLKKGKTNAPDLSATNKTLTCLISILSLISAKTFKIIFLGNADPPKLSATFRSLLAVHNFISVKRIFTCFFSSPVLADRIAWTCCASVNKTVSLQSSRSTESSADLFWAFGVKQLAPKFLWMCPTRADFGGPQ
jgi:hypothetical protein